MAIKINVPEVRLQNVLARMGTLAFRAIAKRAFTKGRAAKSVDGKVADPLTPAYKMRKSKAGKGTRPDQRLTDATAKALGVVKEEPTSVTVGFRTERARKIAESLDKRNDFFGLTKAEAAKVLDIAEKAGKDRARKTRVSGAVKVEIRF